MQNIDSSKLYPSIASIPDAFRLNNYKDEAKYLIDGKIMTCENSAQVYSPICYEDGESEKRFRIGRLSLLDENEAKRALQAAENAYASGMGEWPQMSVDARIKHIEDFAERIREQEKEFTLLEMWEIAKTYNSCRDEFKRTVDYIQDTIDRLQELDASSNSIKNVEGFIAQIRRCPLGVSLIMGPFNYPLNETFAMLLPALIMGNTAVVKLPKYGCLCQEPLLNAFASSFPPGVINIINGDGPTIIPPILKPGSLAVLGFIGSTAVAKKIIAQHPYNNRMRTILGLEAKNPAFVFPDCDIKLSVKECVNGALEFNGQRCTAIKHIWVHSDITEKFLSELNLEIARIKCGMPWEEGVMITPLAEDNKCAQLSQWIQDAQSKGAHIANPGGGKFTANLFYPTVLYPTSSAMDIYNIEQFGPVIPVSSFSTLEEILAYMQASPVGQQASIFTSSSINAAPLIDILVNQVSRINLNAQCRRGPDELPFTGRKDSAEGTLSVHDALRAFSIRSLVVANEQGRELFLRTIESNNSKFLRI
ncbi:MAG: NADP-dependent glyceraldehyde-3-phosphate dehydrogenase [Firmicutes bacterium HGW-Firmicutes-15]|nr:MAG: NADP-dependent glyceraldehyde-3-phosphate dehydrogenase [Firmicutes bacterium HGW-Firmicutes-15]